MEMKEKLTKFGKKKSYYIRKKILMGAFIITTSMLATFVPAYMSTNLSNSQNISFTQTNAEEIQKEGAITNYELTFQVK